MKTIETKVQHTGFCANCGAHKELHHYITNGCPLNGIEARAGKKQVWQDTIFEDKGIKEFEQRAIDNYYPMLEEITKLKENNKTLLQSLIKANKHIEHLCDGLPSFMMFGTEAIIKATGANSYEAAIKAAEL